MRAADPGFVLELAGIRKSFGETRALRDLDLVVRAGEILGIAGPNGAGKSTLVRVLAGEDRQDAGDLLANGSPWDPRGQADGVAVVHQEPQVWENLSLAQNVIVGREQFRFGRPRMSEADRGILKELEIDQYAERPLAECSLAVRQRAEIARAIAQEARLFLFDEPNSALTEEESDRLFAYMHDLAERGRVVILVTHRLGEMVAHCARVVVVRDGAVSAEFRGGTLTEEAIARELVVGSQPHRSESSRNPDGQEGAKSQVADRGQGKPRELAPPALELSQWSHPAGAFCEVSLRVEPGEIVAVVGVEGSGARELVASAAGHAPGVGTRSLAGAANGRNVTERSAYLPADRRHMLFGNLSVADNLVMRLGVPDIAIRPGFLRPPRLRRLASQLVSRYGVRTRTAAAPLPSLSGGNQQKVAIAAAIARRPALLVVEEPTRGVDVGAKADIYTILREFAAGSAGVLLFCTEVPEVFELADRAMIVSRGRIERTLRVSDHPDVSSLATAIAEAEHTLITADDLAASHAANDARGTA